MSILSKIKSDTIKFSKTQRKIGHFLLENQKQIPFMKLKELSEAISVSEVTILNYCHKIGIPSYRMLKKEFELLIKAQLYIPEKMKSTLSEMESVEDVLLGVAHLQRQNLEMLMENNTKEMFFSAVDEIMNARKIHICGLGISKFAGEYLCSRLGVLGLSATQLDMEDFNLYGRHLLRAQRDDLFVLIAFPRYSKETCAVHKYLLSKKKRFISITDRCGSPIAKGAKVVLTSENRALVFYNFLSNTLSLMEILLTLIGYRAKDEILGEFDKMLSLQDFLL